jgi:hypothetical protein
MLDPTTDEAYQWPVTKLDPYVGFVQRFIVGVDPATDPDDLPMCLDSQVIWQIPEPMTIQTRNIDPELLEIIYGQAVVPLCSRQLPTKGTE